MKCHKMVQNSTITTTGLWAQCQDDCFKNLALSKEKKNKQNIKTEKHQMLTLSSIQPFSLKKNVIVTTKVRNRSSEVVVNNFLMTLVSAQL